MSHQKPSVRLMTLLKSAKRLTRAYEERMREDARIAKALESCSLSFSRFTWKMQRAREDLALKQARVAELEDAVKSCHGLEELIAEFLIVDGSRFTNISPSTDPTRLGQLVLGDLRGVGRTSDDQRMRQLYQRRIRKRMLSRLTLPELPSVPEMSDEEAVRVLARTAKGLLAKLEEIEFVLFSCEKAECEAQHWLLPKTLARAEPENKSQFPCCRECRKLIHESDAVKLDLKSVTGGLVNLPPVKLPRRPGRPKKRKREQ